MTFMMVILHEKVLKTKNEIYNFSVMYKSWNDLDFDF
jgi:preprotein translocase subunit SecA